MGRIRDIALSQIVLASPAAAPTYSEAEPVLLVLEKTPSLSLAVGEVCTFLGVRIEPVEDTIGIAQTLHALRPIAVLAIADEIDCAVYDLLMAVAGFDANLPVLIVTDDRASVRGAVHSAHKLWQLTDLVHLEGGIETRDLIDFLFRAGRNSGTGRMMPV